ncbi:hypothetical protein BV20DRAFT_829319 [Pilatotrama ljubarskyi]|nr:hypothetical protein BV20DRAFT_829319 [Pilatotrama ljubarskyi]
MNFEAPSAKRRTTPDKIQALLYEYRPSELLVVPLISTWLLVVLGSSPSALEDSSAEIPHIYRCNLLYGGRTASKSRERASSFDLANQRLFPRVKFRKSSSYRLSGLLCVLSRASRSRPRTVRRGESLPKSDAVFMGPWD